MNSTLNIYHTTNPTAFSHTLKLHNSTPVYIYHIFVNYMDVEGYVRPQYRTIAQAFSLNLLWQIYEQPLVEPKNMRRTMRVRWMTWHAFWHLFLWLLCILKFGEKIFFLSCLGWSLEEITSYGAWPVSAWARPGLGWLV